MVKRLKTRTNADDLTAIDTAFKLQHAAGHLDYTNAELYNRLQKCFAQKKLTGINSAIMFGWASVDGVSHDLGIAIQTRNAVKSKYESLENEIVTNAKSNIFITSKWAFFGFYLERERT